MFLGSKLVQCCWRPCTDSLNSFVWLQVENMNFWHATSANTVLIIMLVENLNYWPSRQWEATNLGRRLVQCHRRPRTTCFVCLTTHCQLILEPPTYHLSNLPTYILFISEVTSVSYLSQVFMNLSATFDFGTYDKTCDLWHIWSEWWGDMAWDNFWQF